MGLRWLVVVVGGVAAWAAARYAACLPILFVVVLVATLATPPRERRLVGLPWLAVLVAVLALSWLVALDHELAFRHSLLAVLAVFLFALSRRARATDQQLAVLAAVVGLTAVVGIGQALGGLEEARGLTGYLAPELREAAAARLEEGRASGTSALPGHFAAMLVVFAPVIAARAMRGPLWIRGAAAALLAVMGVGVVLSRSLAAAALATIVLLLAIGRGGWRHRAVIFGAVAVVALAAGTLLLREDLATMTPVRLRLVNWRTTAWVFLEHPWLGVGLGGVGQAGLLAPSAAANITPYSHNTYLQLLAELGIAGFGLVVAGVATLAGVLRRGFSESPALTIAVVALPLHNLVDFSAYAPEVLLPWVVLAGTLVGRLSPLPARPLPGWLLLTVLGAGALLQAASWRGEVAVGDARAEEASSIATLRAARWTPWAVTPVLEASVVALVEERDRQTLARVDTELASRHWVRPRSASWAEYRAHLLLAQGRRGEALVWAREARRRAPWRNELKALEETCASSS